MAQAERIDRHEFAKPFTELRRYSPAYFNEDGSYTEFGVKMELGKNVIYVPNHKNSLELLAKAKNMKIIPGSREMTPGIAYLCRPEVETHETPVKHNNNSWAEYIIDMHRYDADDGNQNIICLSIIPPGKGTSYPPHTHGINPTNNRGVYEHYIRAKGTAYIGEGENRRLMSNYEVVPPHTEHYIEADENEEVKLLILIENVRGIEDENIHIHPQKK